MKLAIIIPTYDSLNSLKVLIKNIRDFTDENYRIYIIEDGQKKETITWLKEQKDIHALYHKENKGVAVSWNDGLRKAIEDKCTHFAFINDDVMLPKDWWIESKKCFEIGSNLVSNNRLTGWFFILDKKCVDVVGFFDEQFAPFNFEDEDYFERFRQSSLKRGIVNIRIYHLGSKTIKTLDKELVDKVTRDNYMRFRNKYPNKRMNAL